MSETLRGLSFLDAKPGMGSGHFRHLRHAIYVRKSSYASSADPCLQSDGDKVDINVANDEAAPRVHSKRVRFDIEASSFYKNDIMFMEDCQELWYSQAHLRILKKEASRFVKDIIKVEKGQEEIMTFGKVFQRVYDTCCQSFSEESTPFDALEPGLMHSMCMWMSIAADRWGLERPSVKQLHFERSLRRKRIVKQVMEAQSMTEHLDAELKTVCLRKAAERISHPCKLFARVLAQAQETALNH